MSQADDFDTQPGSTASAASADGDGGAATLTGDADSQETTAGGVRPVIVGEPGVVPPPA